MPQETDNSDLRKSTTTSGNGTSKAFGRIIIARHGKPDKDRDLGPALTAKEYLQWWASYELASLKDNGQAPSEKLLAAAKNAPIINSSIRPRAIETAMAIAQGRQVIQNSIFNEAPLPPPNWPDFWKLLPRRWNVLARLSWCFGNSGGQESQTEARIRAGKAAEFLIGQSSDGEDTVVAAHGWFNRMIRPELIRRGWKCKYDGGDSYWSFRIYEKID